jgi:hypothetical protein
VASTQSKRDEAEVDEIKINQQQLVDGICQRFLRLYIGSMSRVEAAQEREPREVTGQAVDIDALRLPRQSWYLDLFSSQAGERQVRLMYMLTLRCEV